MLTRLLRPWRSAEYEAMNHEFSVYKTQRDDYEQKLEGQLNEMTAIQAALKQLEQSHGAYRSYYEAEIKRMQAEAAAKGVNIELGPPPAAGTLGAGGSEKRPREGDSAAAGGADKMARMEPQQQDWSYTSRDSMKVDLVHSLKHSSIVCCVKFSGDGRYVAAGCNRVAYLYDATSGVAAQPVGQFQDQSQSEEDSYIRSVCFTADNQSLITGAEDKTVKVWDIASGRIKHTYGGETGHTLDIYSLDASSDGRIIASGSGDKTVKLWNIAGGECLHTLGAEGNADGATGPTDGVTSVSISPDGRTLAAGSLDKVVRLWDTATGQFLAKLGDADAAAPGQHTSGHSDSVYSVAFSPDGQSLASGSLDNSIMLWDVRQARQSGGAAAQAPMVTKFTGHKDFVLSVAFSVDGSLLMSGSKDRTVQFWEPRAGGSGSVESSKLSLNGHENSVISIGHSSVNRTFVTGSGDRQARIWSYTEE